MSRIGNKIIEVPDTVNITLDKSNIIVKGAKGELQFNYNPKMKINHSKEDKTITITRPSDSKADRTIHGTTRALIANMVEGVTNGFKKELKIIGVGYRAAIQGNKLTVNAGYSHPVELEVPKGLTVTVNKNTEVVVEGIDKQLVGEFAANIRKIRKPEPYKGKGIRYKDEHVRRKEGKKAGK